LIEGAWEGRMVRIMFGIKNEGSRSVGKIALKRVS
jgi:hypothetical protein